MNSTRSRNRSGAALLTLLLPPLALIAVTSILAIPARAQDVTGALQGTVLSPERTPEPDVHVTVSGPHLQGTRETATDRHGFYQFLTLPPGTYELRAGRIGSRPIEVKDVVVTLGHTTAIAPLTLTPQAIEMDPVEVIAPPVSLDPVHATMGDVLESKDYAALPVDRDYKSIITILPHVNQSYRGDPANVAGSTGAENQFFIDGVNVTDIRSGISATSLPYNFVRSVNVRTGGYEARYGRALGAVVDAVTYSGTNDFEANVFGLAQPSSLTMDAKGTSVVREEGAIYYDFGGRVSGPLVRDRLWYSAALNPRTNQVDKEISGNGFFSDKTTTTRFASKLTWRASRATNVDISMFGDPTDRDVVQNTGLTVATIKNPDPLLYQETSGGTTATIRATVTTSRSLQLQASAGRQWNRYSKEPATARGKSELSYVDGLVGSLEGGTIEKIMQTKRGRTSVAAQGTLTLPRHTLVAGAEYQDLQDETSYDATTSYRGDSLSWEVVHNATGGTYHNRSPAAYIQDTWRLTDRLAVNGGLRWSGQYLVGTSGRTWIRIPDEWQPRASFNYHLGSAGHHRVFGSYGRFHQTIPTNITVNWFGDYHQTLSFYSTDPRLPGATPDSVKDQSTLEESAEPHVRGLDHLQAENFDEFTLGYERLIGRATTLTIRAIRRDLRSTFQWGLKVPGAGVFVLGTPGEGEFSFLSPPKREYTALEVAAEGTWRRLGYRASYVLSRSWGNFPGLFNSDTGFDTPGLVLYWSPLQAANSTGFLPNDRPHVFKLSASYAAPFNVTYGAFLTAESGAPVNDWGRENPRYGPIFLVPRGSAGRTPFLWNLDVRLAYDLPALRASRARVQMDILHVGNPRETTWVNELHYRRRDANGNFVSPNPLYKQPRSYQPPTAARLGIEVTF